MTLRMDSYKKSLIVLAIFCSFMAGLSSADAAKALSTNRLNPEKTLIQNADGDLVLNRTASDVTKVLIPVAPFQGDSGLVVKTNLTINYEDGLKKLSVVGSGGVNRALTCEVFTVTKESSTLYASKAKRGGDIEHGGTRTDTVIRADCVNQAKQPVTAYVSFDDDAYSVILTESLSGDSLNSVSPRFDIVIGPLRKPNSH